MIVTLGRLKELGACDKGLGMFRRRFGSRAKVTRERLVQFRKDVAWVVSNLFPEHQVAYHKALRPHWRAFDEATTPHANAHLRARHPSLRAYNKAIIRHWRTYERAKANVLADLLGLK